jgi:type I restriction enzyme S subunit
VTTAKLGEVADIVSGITLGRPLRGQATRRVPYLRVANVKDRWLDLSDVYEIEATEAEIEKCRLQYGDILLTEGGDADKLGRGMYWEEQLPLCLHQNHIFRVRLPNDAFCPEYAAFQFGSPYGKAYFAAHAKQTTGIATINRRVLGNFPLIRPSLGDQRRIAARLREQLAEASQAQAAVQTQFVAVRRFPAAALRDILGRRTSVKWPRKRFGEICNIIATQVDPTLPEYRDLPHVNGENIDGGRCRLLTVRSAAEDGMMSGKYLFDAGSVLYSKLRPYLRKAVVAEFRGLCSADMYPLRVNRDWLDPCFTAWLLVGDEFTAYAVGESQRSRMPKLNREQLFAWEAPVPDLAEQRGIATRLESQLSECRQFETEISAKLEAIGRLPGAILGQAFRAREVRNQ